MEQANPTLTALQNSLLETGCEAVSLTHTAHPDGATAFAIAQVALKAGHLVRLGKKANGPWTTTILEVKP